MLSTAAAFNTWADAAEEAKHHRAIMSRLLHAMQNRVVVAAFNEWLDAVADGRRIRALLKRALARCAQHDSRLVGPPPHCFPATRNDIESSDEVPLLRHTQGEDAFHMWADAVAEARHLRAMLQRVFSFQLAAAWRKWKEVWTHDWFP
jgi:dienelactone hydrolase